MRRFRNNVVDWSQIVRDLEARGMSLREIGTACDKGDLSDGGKTWANALKNIPDTEPKAHHGALLLYAWIAKTGRPYSQLPIVPGKEKKAAAFFALEPVFWRMLLLMTPTRERCTLQVGGSRRG